MLIMLLCVHQKFSTTTMTQLRMLIKKLTQFTTLMGPGEGKYENV